MKTMHRVALLLFLIPSHLFASDVRTLSGRHITLRTDAPVDAEVNALPTVFDQAFDQWCDYFDIDPDDHANWRVNAILLRGPASRERFVAAQMMPAGLWDFKSGYSQGHNLWLYDQTSAYYRRHLLLHEGVHCFMNTLLGGSGPPWYAEGMAELLATHQWANEKLTVNYFPRSQKEVPKLGRIEMTREAIAGGRTLSLRDVAAYGDTAHRENEPYGWCWATAAFLDGHPRYHKRFRTLPKYAAKADFASEFARRYQQDNEILNEEWQVYLANLGHGYDFARMQLDLVSGEPLPPKGATVEIVADRGWQSSGIALQAGRKYRITATGRFQVAHKPRPWMTEANGVTIRYVQGQPLGLLLGAVRPDDFDATEEATPLAKPQAIGTSTTLVPVQSGTLYLRINDAPGDLVDNVGKLRVTVRPLPD
jgi:hypothetical protein